jgi:hypothetical protein
MTSTTNRPPRSGRTTPDSGFDLCFACGGSGNCQACDGLGYTDRGTCLSCDYGVCPQCGGTGQLKVSALEAASGSARAAPVTIIFEQGHETAPDSPWGLLRLRLGSDGPLAFEQRNRGVVRTRRGRVDPSRVDDVLASLQRTAFPSPPQDRFKPGASILRITIEPDGAHVDVDYFAGLKMEGYRDVISALSELNGALRENDDAILAEWKYAEDGA